MPVPELAASPLAYSYLRFSSHSQAEGDSVRRQTVNPEEWCKRNGVRLDTSVTFEDRGRSAFKKHHRHREALTEFRRFVAEGRIRPGSFLIIENLDRLSREQERIAVELLLSIVNAGITVVQLMPEEQVFSPTNLDMLGLMRAVIQMAQAHQESAKKAKRLGEVWGAKRNAAVNGTGVLTSRVPGWVDLVDGKMKLNAGRAALVRRLFKMCLEGYGGQATARKLNAENVPTMTGRGKWHQSAVTYIVRSRSVLGEHQPHTVHGRDSREPVGKPIADYYPRVISDKTFNAAQGTMEGRISLAGRPPAKRTNIFKGLLRSSRDGRKIGIATNRWDGGGKNTVYSNADRGGSRTFSFPAEAFEHSILTALREIDPREVVGESAAAEKVLTLTGERSILVDKVEKLVAILGDDPSPAIALKVREMEAAIRSLDDKLVVAQQEAANPLANAWGDVPALVQLAGTPDGRVRLAAVLRRVVESIWCLFLPRGENRVAAVQMRLTGGRQRSYLILHRPARQLGKVKRRAAWSFISGAWPAKVGEYDLRDQADAAVLEKILQKIDPDVFEAPATAPGNAKGKTTERVKLKQSGKRS